MISRRGFIGRSTAALALQLLGFLKPESAFAQKNKAEKKSKAAHQARDISSEMEDVTQYVNIAIGTGGHGHTYPGATVPFGAVQLSPDTATLNWDHCSGYYRNDPSITGFSHTHLSGTGCGDLLDFLIMPSSAKNPGLKAKNYQTKFSHDDESMTPGYYSVLFKDQGLRAELTATERVGLHRYTFAESGEGHLLFDLNHHYDKDSDAVTSSTLKVVGQDTLVGGRVTNLWAPGRQIYFAMKVSKPFKSIDIEAGGSKLPSSARDANNSDIKCAMHFDVEASSPLLVKLAISSVSTDGALKNLETEVRGWDFDLTRQAAHDAWRAHLSRIRIQTADHTKKEIFYTALYHAMVAPTLFDDVDGQYRGMDGAVHALPAGAHNYSTYSLWDTFRAAHPLYTLIQPERVPDLVNTLVRMAHESPAGVPVWPLYGVETACMTGYHSVSVIAEACVKGFRGINYQQAYAPIQKRVFQDDYQGLGSYRALGYVACDGEDESVSKTLEYSYNDWGAAHVARFAGALQDSAALMKRSLNYRNLFDRTTKFIRARLKNSSWALPFDPFDIGHRKNHRDYTESNAWQTTFGIMHDPQGLIDQFGGAAPFVQKLDSLFVQSSAMPADMPKDVAGLVGQYAHGNEPSHHIAYLYTYADCAYKTQARVRSLLETQYTNQPDGLAGNEDCGQMSAWYIMSAMGFYAVDPVSGNYVFGSPLFDLARLELANKKYLLLEAQRKNETDCYIQSITFNGAAFDRIWFTHKEIQNGGHFVLVMGPQPSVKFGVGAGHRPPSAGEQIKG